jgi:hypothetical protein
MKGAKRARYDIQGSGLPPPHADSRLQSISISAGKIVTGGAAVALGIMDRPPHMPANGYLPKLISLESRYMMFWDEGTKQGWLVNGTSCLLHLVRSYLRYVSKGNFASRLLFDSKKLK